MRVEMLSTGDEVLHGQIIDTNAAWLSDYFFQNGLPLHCRTTVGDDVDILVSTFIERSHRADVIIVNGGLGPTSDDLSALAAAKALGVPLVEHREWIAVMERYFISRGRVMPETNLKQALLPENATLVDNPVGTACGFSIVLNKCLFFFTPGVPSEFKVMVSQQILPDLKRRYALPDSPVCLRLTSFGRSESSLAKQFDCLTSPEGCVLGYRSSTPIIEIKLTGPASSRQAMEKHWQQIKDGVGDNLIFEGTEGLANKVSRQLKERGFKVAVTEQFSAGLLSWTLHSANGLLTDSAVISDETDSLQELLLRASKIAESQNAQIGLAVGGFHEGILSFALHTPNQRVAQKIQYLPNNHSLKEQQEVSVILMLDMLSRWLDGREVVGHYEWLVQTEVQESEY